MTGRPRPLRWLEPLHGAFSVAGTVVGTSPDALDLKQLEASFAGVGDTQILLSSASVTPKSLQAGVVNFTARSGEPHALAAHPVLAPFVGALPASLPAPVELQGRFDLKEQGRISFENLNGRVGEHVFSGAVTIDTNSKPVAVRVDFRAPYVALPGLGFGSPASDDSKKAKEPVFSSEPLPVHLLDQVNLAADVQIDVLDGGGWQLGTFATTFHATPGGLDVSLLDGQLAGGRVSFKVDVKRPASGQIGVNLVWTRARHGHADTLGEGLDAAHPIGVGF